MEVVYINAAGGGLARRIPVAEGTTLSRFLDEQGVTLSERISVGVNGQLNLPSDFVLKDRDRVTVIAAKQAGGQVAHTEIQEVGRVLDPRRDRRLKHMRRARGIWHGRRMSNIKRKPFRPDEPGQAVEIILTSDIAEALAEEARRRSTTPELLALDCLRERFAPTPEGEVPAGGKSLADFLEGYVGVFASEENVPGGAQMSKDTGKQFAEGMVRKRQQGRP